MDRVTHEVYEFGDYRLDVARRTLTRSSGQPIHLKPKAFDVLRYLVEHAGELVEKRTLIAGAWPGVVVEEHNLNKTVSVLRRTLGDDPEAQEYIATIPGRGYQFVRPVVPSVARSARQPADDRPVPTPSGQQHRQPIRRWLVPIAVAIAGAAIAIAMMLQEVPGGSSIDRSPIYALLDARPAERLYASTASPRPSRTAVRVSPDGRTIVFGGVQNGVPQLFKRRLNEPQATPIPGTEGARSQFFSPDGEWIGFWQAGHFKRSLLAGGPPVEIGAVEGGGAPMGASWGLNGRIVYGMPALAGIWSIPAGGGTAERVTHAADLNHLLPHVLPDGRAMVFTATGVRHDDLARVVLHRFDTGEQRMLLDDAADARYLAPGYLLFMRRGTLMAAAFDAERLEVKGTPSAVIDNVMQAINQPNSVDETFAGQFDAANGTLIFIPGGPHPAGHQTLVSVSRDGTPTRLALEPGPIYAPRLSPNGKLVAYFTALTGAGATVWVYDGEHQTARRLTFDGDSEHPLWSPDSGRLIVVGSRTGLRSIGVNGNEPSTEILSAAAIRPIPSSWVGTTLLTVVERDGHFPELWSMSTEGPADARPVLQRGYPVEAPALSPDGRWLAYVSGETGVPEIYVQRYPDGGDTVRISSTPANGPFGGANSPLWTQGGRELVFVQWHRAKNVLQVFSVPVDTSAGFRFESPRLLFEGDYSQGEPVRGYDVSADGRTFVMIKRGAPEPFVTAMNLVLNWEPNVENRTPFD